MMAERRIAETETLTSNEAVMSSAENDNAELLIAIKHCAQELLNCKQSKIAASSAQVRPLVLPHVRLADVRSCGSYSCYPATCGAISTACGPTRTIRVNVPEL